LKEGVTRVKRRLRISILTSSYPRYSGDAAGAFIEDLAVSLTRKKMIVQVVCPHDQKYKFKECRNGIQIRRFPYFFPTRLQKLCYGAGILSALKKEVSARSQLPFFLVAQVFFSFVLTKRFKADLVHAHWSLPQGMVGVICKKILKIPCIISLHGSDVFGVPPWIKRLNRMIVNSCDACTANSRMTAEKALVGDVKDIQVVPMSVKTLFLKHPASIPEIRKNQSKNILFVGRLIDWKGVKYLIKALPRVLEKHPGAILTIVGDGPEKSKLNNLTRKIGVASSVSFIGEINQLDLPGVYLSSDVFVLPSVVNEKGNTEGLGVVLLEAMACGLPAVGSNVGGIPDVIKDGANGFLVEPANVPMIAEKINILLQDDHLRKEMGRAGRRFVEKNFSWEMTSRKLIDLYGRVLASKSHNGRQAGDCRF